MRKDGNKTKITVNEKVRIIGRIEKEEKKTREK